MNEWTEFKRQYVMFDGVKNADLRTDKELRTALGTDECYINNRYQVFVYRNIVHENWPAMIWLSIKRIDKEAIHDWRDMQRIKNEIIGEENEGVEMFPAESRLVDTANQYHIWVLEDKKLRFPFGFNERAVHNTTAPNVKQRDL